MGSFFFGKGWVRYRVEEVVGVGGFFGGGGFRGWKFCSGELIRYLWGGSSGLVVEFVFFVGCCGIGVDF